MTDVSITALLRENARLKRELQCLSAAPRAACDVTLAAMVSQLSELKKFAADGQAHPHRRRRARDRTGRGDVAEAADAAMRRVREWLMEVRRHTNSAPRSQARHRHSAKRARRPRR